MTQLGGGYTCYKCGTYHRTTVLCNCNQTNVGNDGFEFDNSSTCSPENKKSSNTACFIDNDMSDYVGFINFLRRETGMSKTKTLIALEQCRDQVAEILLNWNRAHGKKTS